MYMNQTTVRLLAAPLDKENRNQITFPNAETQSNYFASKTLHILTASTYQRQDGVVRIDKAKEEINDSNYCMFQNAAHGSKWYYAYIDKIEFLNETTSLVYLTTDSWQTFQFDVEIMQSFVVREHVSDDTIGANKTEEQLETGEYISNPAESPVPLDNVRIVVASTVDLNNVSNKVVGAMYGDVYSGVRYYAYDTGDDITTILNPFLEALNEAAKIDAIVAIFMIPAFCVYDLRGGAEVTPNALNNFFEYSISKNYSTINGYTPKNNKLFLYPFNYLKCSNGNGNGAEYKYEFFSDSSCKFMFFGNICPNPTIYSIPENYKITSGLNYDEKMNVDGFPQCSWNTDVYKAWLTQNVANIGTNAISSVISSAAGAAGSSPIAIAGGITSIASEVGQIYQHKIMPPQFHGSSSSNGSAYSTGLAKFRFYKMQITAEFAKRIDSYFELYGYKVDQMKIPNVTGRPNWNYVKTIEANITGNIPEEYMQDIKRMFNTGVTFWHNGDSVGNYSLNNH